MRALPSRAALDRLVPVLAAATVVAFAAGSSSVHAVKEVALDARWAALALLAAAATAWTPALRRLPAAVLVAAAGFAGLALVSSLWSVAPRLSAGRALSLLILLVSAALLAAGVRTGGLPVGRLLAGLLGGAAAVAVLGAAVLAVSYDTAVALGSIEAPPRFRGFGENPNTAALLLALALPLALGLLLQARDRRRRALAAGTVALFAASVIGSGSRGSLAAAGLGAAVVLGIAATTARRRAALVGVVCVAVGVGALLQSLPRESAAAAETTAGPRAGSPRYVDAEQIYPLNADIGRPLPGHGEPAVRRSLLGASGRTSAWRGAVERIADRPLLGFGFGTEAKAFVDRYYAFFSDLPENSYLGVALQLGLLGLAALLALLATLLLAGRRAAGAGGSPWSGACAGVVAAGLALGVVQSYLYSVGNIGTATFWIAAFSLPALAGGSGR